MPKKERWGRPYPDTRDRSIYYECLVRRGEFYLSLDFIDQWDELLARMNAGKRGRPFKYPEPFIAWMACVHVFLQMPYRQMEGFARKLATFLPSLRAADYTTLSGGFSVWISRSRQPRNSSLTMSSLPSTVPGSRSPTGANGCERNGESGEVGSRSMP